MKIIDNGEWDHRVNLDNVLYERSSPFLREMRMEWERPGTLCMRGALQKAFQTSKTQYDKNISMIYKFDLKQKSMNN